MERDGKLKLFRFIGDPKDYSEPELEVNTIYKGSHIFKKWVENVEWHSENYPQDWEEVTEQETEKRYHESPFEFEESKRKLGIPNQDQPASEMTKFEKCVIDIIGNIYSNINIKTQTPTYQEISQIAINQAKETFKQLDELK